METGTPTESLLKGDICICEAVKGGRVKLKVLEDARSCAGGVGQPEGDCYVKYTAYVAAQRGILETQWLYKSDAASVTMVMSFAAAQKQQALMGGGHSMLNTPLPNEEASGDSFATSTAAAAAPSHEPRTAIETSAPDQISPQVVQDQGVDPIENDRGSSPGNLADASLGNDEGCFQGLDGAESTLDTRNNENRPPSGRDSLEDILHPESVINAPSADKGFMQENSSENDMALRMKFARQKETPRLKRRQIHAKQTVSKLRMALKNI